MHLADPAGQPLILDPTSGLLAGLALLVRGRRHVLGLTDRLDAEALAIHVVTTALGAELIGSYLDAGVIRTVGRKLLQIATLAVGWAG
jgi:hypothetical protein